MKITIEFDSKSETRIYYWFIIDAPNKQFKHIFEIRRNQFGDANNGTDRMMEFTKEIIRQFNEDSPEETKPDLQ